MTKNLENHQHTYFHVKKRTLKTIVLVIAQFFTVMFTAINSVLILGDIKILYDLGITSPILTVNSFIAVITTYLISLYILEKKQKQK